MGTDKERQLLQVTPSAAAAAAATTVAAQAAAAAAAAAAAPRIKPCALCGMHDPFSRSQVSDSVC